ncbi:GntR family transcriptional regulator [Pseudomonas asplenii]|uniref:GntR family transcriptional regulator n=1 Tax=Pseudomonas asplenii TaxID=53407 RepID=A0A1H1YNV5_9PSED|nr:GntR family transcriptional regulator [Pseudomonas asplenii]SDT23148.1 GntR family transcriptional regulator [Pseudomonas asplenii]
MTLQRASATSLYEQIVQQLLQEIQQGHYGIDGKLPSEAELMARFAVSRVTIRLALGKLEEEGVVERKQGKGTFVAAQQVRHNLDALRSFHESLLLQGLQPTMNMLGHARIPVPEELRLLFDDHCVKVERLHWVDQEPIAYACSYLTDELREVDWKEMAEVPLYSVLERTTGRAVIRADMAIRAREADKALAAHLGVKRGTALLVMERTSWFDDDRCCDRTTFFIRPERYAFVLSGVFKTR